MTTAPLANIPPDQSERVTQLINANLFDRQGQADHATARLIAAAMHPGAGSALAHFAATGQFDVVVLIREVAVLDVPHAQMRWHMAFVGYLESASAKQPWRRATTLKVDRKRATTDPPERPFSEGAIAIPESGLIPPQKGGNAVKYKRTNKADMSMRETKLPRVD